MHCSCILSSHAYRVGLAAPASVFCLHFASFCMPFCFIYISLALLHRFACPPRFLLHSPRFACHFVLFTYRLHFCLVLLPALFSFAFRLVLRATLFYLHIACTFASFCMPAPVFFGILLCFVCHFVLFAYRLHFCLVLHSCSRFLLHFASFCVPLCFICISLALLHCFACLPCFLLHSPRFTCLLSFSICICTVFHASFRFPLHVACIALFAPLFCFTAYICIRAMMLTA